MNFRTQESERIEDNILNASLLETKFGQLVDAVNKTAEDSQEAYGFKFEIVSESTTESQIKYCLANRENFFKLLANPDLQATQVAAAAQTDTYFIGANTNPTYLTETIHIREQNQLEVYNTHGLPIEIQATNKDEIKAIYKTDPHGDTDSGSFRTAQILIAQDVDSSYALLEAVQSVLEADQELVTEYTNGIKKIKKNRVTYSAVVQGEAGAKVPVEINLDMDVWYYDVVRNDNGSYTDVPQGGYGDILEVTCTNNGDQVALANCKKLAEQLSGTKISIDAPYVAREKFLARISERKAREAMASDPTKEEEKWASYAVKPYYYSVGEGFMLGLDPRRIPVMSSDDTTIMNAIMQKILMKAGEYNGGMDTLSGEGTEYSSDVVAFKGATAFLNEYFSVHRPYRYWGPQGSPIQRMVFSLNKFKDEKANNDFAGKRIVMIHYVGDHNGYDRWIKKHRVG